jgi:eukaryotic-like serine/threonine-protein kinase
VRNRPFPPGSISYPDTIGGWSRTARHRDLRKEHAAQGSSAGSNDTIDLLGFMTPASQIAHYRITSKLGEGGMGTVYRATDTKLKREVAIKMLPEAFANDLDRLARFEREAQVLASLNHPNIAAIYGTEERALVMELVEGVTLSGPLPLETALDYARQVADALEAAHEKGIVHRDLKPGNIMVTPTGVVKVLDFGLAAVQGSVIAGRDPSISPTLAMGATQVGTILGTAAYMSPEQARGKPVDKRADIWAFGVVLYEMLTGRQLFRGDDVTETLASVIKGEPAWDAVPPSLRQLLKRCLEKDPKKRLRDIGDAWQLLEETPAAVAAPVASGPLRFGPMAAGAAALFAVGLGVLAVVHFTEKPPVAELVRFQIWPPQGRQFASPETIVSPDGRHVAFLIRSGELNQIWVHSLDSLQARPLAGTEGSVSGFFWSPDSRFLAFATQDKLKKVAFSGSAPQIVCDLPSEGVGGAASFRGAWNRAGVILFAAFRTGFWRVSQAGGTPRPVTEINASRNEIFHVGPVFLPDDRHFLYARLSSSQPNEVFVGVIDMPPNQQSTKPVLAAGPAQYVPDPGTTHGHLLYQRYTGSGGRTALSTLFAQAFDPGRLEVTGEPAMIIDNLPGANTRPFSVSANGVLAYQTATGEFSLSTQLTWFDRGGKIQGKLGEPSQYNTVSISPDGTRAALSIGDREASASVRRPVYDLWVHDLARGNASKLAGEPGSEWMATWSPDGKRIIYSLGPANGPDNLYQIAADGSAAPELLLQSYEDKTPQDWSRDGRFLIYTVTPKAASASRNAPADLWVLPLSPGNSGSNKPEPYWKTKFSEGQPQFSPDGRFVAYRSDESGRDEIYVRPFPNAASGKWMVSTTGGTSPLWRADGKEMFYLAPGSKAMAVEVSTTPTFSARIPKALFDAPVWERGGVARNVRRWAVAADGKKFLINATSNAASGNATPINVILNWQALLKR